MTYGYMNIFRIDPYYLIHHWRSQGRSDISGAIFGWKNIDIRCVVEAVATSKQHGGKKQFYFQHVITCLWRMLGVNVCRYDFFEVGRC